MTYQVNIESFAKVDGEKINVQTTVEHVADGRPPEQVVIEKVIDLNEQVTRDALIALGWTPPGGRCAAYNTIRERIQAIQYEGEQYLVSWRFETPAPPFPSDLPPTHERIAAWLDAAVDALVPGAAT